MTPLPDLAKEFELEPGERIVRQVRKSGFFLFLEVLPYPILAIFPLLHAYLLDLTPYTAPYATLIDASGLAHAAFGVWLLVCWTAAWGVFTRYYLNLWVLTDQRVVEVKQLSFFNREVSSLLLTRVQDVTTHVEGMLPSMLGIGTIRVQTAGTIGEFDMPGIRHPEEMRDAILQYAGQRVTAIPSAAGV